MGTGNYVVFGTPSSIQVTGSNYFNYSNEYLSTIRNGGAGGIGINIKSGHKAIGCGNNGGNPGIIIFNENQASTSFNANNSASSTGLYCVLVYE